MRTILLALFLTCCSAAGSDGQPSVLAFHPADNAAWALFEKAAPTFVARAGVEPFAAIDGSAIRTMPRPEGLTSCADTTIQYVARTAEVRSIHIDLYVPAPEGCFADVALTLEHEMIHAIRSGSGLDLADPDQGHSERGLFMGVAGDSRFDDTTLERVCEAVPCSVFDPEL